MVVGAASASPRGSAQAGKPVPPEELFKADPQSPLPSPNSMKWLLERPPRPPGGPHRLESLCHRENFSGQGRGESRPGRDGREGKAGRKNQGLWLLQKIIKRFS